MMMNRPLSVAMAFALLCMASSALAQQGGPPSGPPADIQKRVRAAQDRAFKQDYGFTDKQIAAFRKRDVAITASYDKKIEALRKQVAKAPAPKKRELYTQMRALEKQKDKARTNSLLAVATPAQQTRIKAKLAL